MNNVLYNKLVDILKEEAEDTLKNETDNDIKIRKMEEIFNLKKIFDHYYELEPTLRRYFADKSMKEKFGKERE